MAISARQWRLVRQYITRDNAHPENAAELAGVDPAEVVARLAREPVTAPAAHPTPPVDQPAAAVVPARVGRGTGSGRPRCAARSGRTGCA